ncbi:hypothetical protein C2845_PM14G08230 [Panicum miliaceum]|uniref:Transposon protein, putative, CACTA, En/Spm sub-class n=1 Tax=Panicum miliaceum TaxID=4540 RepID=A0A3L6PN62_PANMI|nr:hypothetical protein C2845_PM14G08230 [Panicum miliaceum]
MRELHDWYLKTSADGYVMFAAQVKHSDLHRGLADVWIEFESLWFLYHQDALDKSLVSAFDMMKVQECRKRGYYDIGFMDPDIINMNSILLSIEIDGSRVVVFDLKKKPIEEYQNLIDILQKAWARFLKKHIGLTDNPSALYIKMDFQIWRMKEDLIEPERVRAIQEALCEFLLDEVINPKGEFYADHRISVGQIYPNKGDHEDED